MGNDFLLLLVLLLLLAIVFSLLLLGLWLWLCPLPRHLVLVINVMLPFVLPFLLFVFPKLLFVLLILSFHHYLWRTFLLFDTLVRLLRLFSFLLIQYQEYITLS